MDWGLVLDPSTYPQYTAAAIMIALAAWLLRLDRHKRAMRVFALFLVLRATNMAMSVAGGASLQDPAVAGIFWTLAPFFTIATPFALLYFISLYPKPRGWFARTPHGPVALILGCGMLEYLLLFRPDLLAVLGVDASGTLYVLRYGPLILSAGVLFLGYGLASLVLARDYIQMEEGSAARASLLIVCLAFALNALYDSAGELFRTSPNAAAFAGDWISLNSLIVQVAWVPVVVGTGLLIHHAWTRGDDRTRSQVARFVAVLPLPVLSNAALSFFVTGPAWQNPWAVILMGIWRLALPVGIAYALVRHQLFDLDLKVKWAVKQSTVLAAFTAVFFLVSEGVELIVETQLGPVLGLASAGLLTLALSPLQDLGQQVAEGIGPDTTAIAEMDPQERTRFYEEQVQIAMMDDELTPKERMMLDNLAERMDLPDVKAEEIERDAGLPEVPGGSLAGSVA